MGSRVCFGMRFGELAASEAMMPVLAGEEGASTIVSSSLNTLILRRLTTLRRASSPSHKVNMI